jgi:GxxExxY protein
MERDPLAYAVIGHAMAVHREIGPGVDEAFYHQALAERLEADRIEHLIKPRRALEYRGSTADVFEPDFVLPGKLVPELKALIGGFEPEHFLQLRVYLKFWKIRRGLLFDFGKESLVTRSYVYDDPPRPRLDPGQLITDAPPAAELSLVRALSECLSRVVATHGFGYRDTTYRGLLVADLNAEGIECVSSPTVAVRVRDRVLGESILSRILVAGQSAVLTLSQRDGIRAADRAVLQTTLRLLALPWGLIAHFGKRELEVQWVLPVQGTQWVPGGA